MELMLIHSSDRIRALTRWLPLAALLLVVMVISGCAGGAPAQGGWSGGTLRGDTLYLGSRDGRLVAVNIADGSRQWTIPLETGTTSAGLGCSKVAIVVTIYGTPAVSDNVVYIGGYNGRAYAFADGKDKPRTFPSDKTFVKGGIVGGVAIGGGKVFFGSSDGMVYALPAAGSFEAWAEEWKASWAFKTDAKIWSTPAVDRGVVFVGSFDKKLYALDAGDGTKKWEFSAEGAIVTTPVVDGDTVYIGSFDRRLYAIDVGSGSMKWQFEARHGFWATPVVLDGRIYAPSLDGNVYVLDAASGQKISQTDLGAPVSSSPVVIGKSVVVATEESRGSGAVKSGAVIWNINSGSDGKTELARFPGEKVYASLVGGQGTVYVHTDRDSVYGIDVITGAKRQFTIK
jgi:outer membrane protein assembly factor BamB